MVMIGNVGNDVLYGEAGNDEIVGSIGNDLLDGGSGDDRLLAFNPYGGFTDPTERDIVTGGSGYDTFVLGLRNPIFGDQIFYAASGDIDYALITDFKVSKDTIELLANAGTYNLGAAPAGTSQGTGVFFNNDLIAVIAGIELSQFDLNSNTFNFV
jgi:Ca2+-binding RTX toxin-like protein